MSTIKSSDEHLTLNADGTSKDIKFQANGVEKASISSAGAFTSTTIDATKLTGALPAIDGSNLTGLSSFDPNGAVTINDSGADVDFRVESDNDAYALEVNGAGITGIGCGGTVTGLVNNAWGEGNNTFLYMQSDKDGDDSMVQIGNRAAVGSTDETATLHIAPSTAGKGVMLRANREGDFTSAANSSSSFEITTNYQNSAKTPFKCSGNGVVSVGTEGSNGGSANGLNVRNHGWATMATFSTGTTTGAQYIQFRNSNGTVGSINMSGSSTSYNTSSDYRLKENVVDLDNATDRLKQLKPKRFNFTADDSVTVDGFLAHEVSNVVPEAISGTKDEVETWQSFEDLPDGVSVGDNKLDVDGNTIPKYQAIDQAKLVPLLVKTIQELEARITALEA